MRPSPATGPPPVREVLRASAGRLRAAGVGSPEHDAAALLAHVLGTSPGRLVLVDGVPSGVIGHLDGLVARRAAREPLQHLTGTAAFRHLELAVGPGVFVPRPETELLAGWAVARAAELVSGSPGPAPGTGPVVIDLGTGSGAIAASVATEVPQARVHATELDPRAAAWAARNLEGTGVDLRTGDLAEAFPELDGTVDVVVSNPPYIPLEAWESVAPEARDHDPDTALFSGPDGLVALRAVERRAAALLRPGGVVGVEHADSQGELVPALFAAAGRWAEVVDHRDLAGRPRYTTARLAR